MKKYNFLMSVIITSVLLSGCGSVSDSISTSSNYLADTKAESFDYNDEYNENTDEENSEANIVKDTAMIIRDADISVDVSNLEDFNNNIIKKVKEYDGYFEESTINNYENEYQSDRYAYFTIRIPQEKLDDFLGNVEENSSITSKTITSSDVSLEYIDTKAHIESLEKEKENLERILEEAQTVSEIIEIQDRISSVQYELDSAKGQKRYLEGRVSYSTVNISAHEERSVEHPISSKFQVNFKEKVIDGLSYAFNILISIIAYIPVIIVIATFALIFIWIIKKIIKKFFKKD